jgi:hypothetical protein
MDALEPAVSEDGGRALAHLEPWQRSELAAMLPSVGWSGELQPLVPSGERHRVVRALLEGLAGERPLAVRPARGWPENAIAKVEAGRNLVGIRPWSQVGCTLAEARPYRARRPSRRGGEAPTQPPLVGIDLRERRARDADHGHVALVQTGHAAVEVVGDQRAAGVARTLKRAT